MVYLSYRTKKYKKLLNFWYTVIFDIVQHRTVNFRYSNGMSFLIPRYTENTIYTEKSVYRGMLNLRYMSKISIYLHT